MHDGFENAARLMPSAIRSALYRLDGEIAGQAEEIRLRAGKTATVLLPWGEAPLEGTRPVSGGDLQSVLEAASASSVHAVRGELKRGFISARGGVRVGVCGTAVVMEGVSAIRSVSSLSVRIPRQHPKAGEQAIEKIKEKGGSVLILSPPGGGKTTFLRELVRSVSDAGVRVALADERCEVAAVFECEPQFDVGLCTDVLSGAPKAEAAMLLLRAMNPQVIAMDEVTSVEDAGAVESITNCGVRVFATAHAASVAELMSRPVYDRLLSLRAFDTAVIISGRGADRRYTVAEL